MVEVEGKRSTRSRSLFTFPSFLFFVFRFRALLPSLLLCSSIDTALPLSHGISHRNRPSLSNGGPPLAARRASKRSDNNDDNDNDPTIAFLAIDSFPCRLCRAQRSGPPSHPRRPADHAAGLAGVGHEPVLVGQRRR